MNTNLHDLDDVIGNHSGHARTVLEYTAEMKRLADAAKEPGFTAERWSSLERFVTSEGFVRVGPFKDQMDWAHYVEFLTLWATHSYWECSFRSISEAGSVVFLELEERLAPGDSAGGVNSVSVYEFDDAGKICALDVYLQMANMGG